MADSSAVKRRLRQRAEQAHRKATGDIVKQIRDGAPVKTRQLKRSVKATPTTAVGSKFVATIYVDPPRTPAKPDNVAVAKFNESGTRPHVIKAKRAKALRFKQGGKVVFARSVHHPGTRARPWFYPPLRRWGETLRRRF